MKTADYWPRLFDDDYAAATASFIEVWIDETEKRTWFLFEATRDLTLSRGERSSKEANG
jgi:hypothetical protein